MKEKLRKIINDTSTIEGKIFDYFIQSIILISLFTFGYETFPDNSEETKAILKKVDIVTVIIFSIEYLLRLYVSNKKLKYVFSFFGIIDLIEILPFYLGVVVDLRSLRILRIFRVFRTLKLIRFNKALNRFDIAFKLVKEELILFVVLTFILIFLSATGIYFFEHNQQPKIFSSIFDSLWWAIVTLTTVGYGDVYPVTIGGKVFTFFVLIIGIGIVTFPANLIATALSKARSIEDEENKTIDNP